MTILKFNKKNNFNEIKNSNLCNSRGDTTNNNKNIIFFSKYELTSILNLYSKQVSKGFWKDYALDSSGNTAIFSIYKHSQDKPIYQIIKKSIKGFRNMPDFFITKDKEVINKSREISIILSKFEKKLSIRKYL
ncbi:MAG: DUF2794 domain-containing protein [Candidatus Puniceispirillales bacterium]